MRGSNFRTAEVMAPKRARSAPKPKDEYETRLEDALFPARDITSTSLGAKDPSMTESAPAAWVDDDEADILVDISQSSRLKKLRTAADENVIKGDEYIHRLRAFHQSLHPVVRWAQATKPGEQESAGIESEEQEQLRFVQAQSGKLSDKGAKLPAPSQLPARLLDIARCPNVTGTASKDSGTCAVKSMSFEKSSGALLCTGGFDSRLRIYSVDTAGSSLRQSVFLQSFPIHTCNWIQPSTVLCTSRRPFMYIYNLEAQVAYRVEQLAGRREKSWESMQVSRNGELGVMLGSKCDVLLFSTATQTAFDVLRTSARCTSAVPSADGRQVVTCDVRGSVETWSVAERRVIHRHQIAEVNGGIIALAPSPEVSQIAVGGTSGIVSTWRSGGGSPTEFKHLTTPISGMHYSHDGQLLVTYSSAQREGLRCCHLASGSTYANWPTPRTPLAYVSTLALSPNSGFMAIGNDKGNVLLYRLKHYAAI